MAFTPRNLRTPTAIGTVTVIIGDPDGTNPNRSIAATVEILDAAGNVMDVWEGDLQPHLAQGQIDGAIAFLDSLRTQAESELLPS